MMNEGHTTIQYNNVSINAHSIQVLVKRIVAIITFSH